jgi:hypothetical protein
MSFANPQRLNSEVTRIKVGIRAFGRRSGFLDMVEYKRLGGF